MLDKFEQKHHKGINITLLVFSIIAVMVYIVVGVVGLFVDALEWDMATVAMSLFSWYFSSISFASSYKKARLPHPFAARIIFIAVGFALFALAIPLCLATTQTANLNTFFQSFARASSIIALISIFVQCGADGVIHLITNDGKATAESGNVKS